MGSSATKIKRSFHSRNSPPPGSIAIHQTVEEHVLGIWRKIDEIAQANPTSPAHSAASTPDVISKRLLHSRGWKTVKIYISSTFVDFVAERNVLAKEVFPQLRDWAAENLLVQVLDYDMRWQVPDKCSLNFILKACLQEMETCYKENVQPFFLGLLSEKVGWIPEARDLSKETLQDLEEKYQLPLGLSMTEMEIMFGAYRFANPNALFMLRAPEFLDSVPDGQKSTFTDDFYTDEQGNLLKLKLQTLRTRLRQRFLSTQVVSYGCSLDSAGQQFTGFETFAKTVLNFFKDRLGSLYPSALEESRDPLAQLETEQRLFLEDRLQLAGRDELLGQIREYICGQTGIGSILLVSGEAGSGVTSIVTEAVRTAQLLADDGSSAIKDWSIFYHFAGSTALSFDSSKFLKRLLRFLRTNVGNDFPTSGSLPHLVLAELNNVNLKPSIIFVDALDHLEKVDACSFFDWLPAKLQATVRCIFSTEAHSPQEEFLMSRTPIPQKLVAEPWDTDVQREILKIKLNQIGKTLTAKQTDQILAKRGAGQPLWQCLALQELRTCPSIELDRRIRFMADCSVQLLVQHICRLEREAPDGLFAASVCVISASKCGLYHQELREILGVERNQTAPLRFMPRDMDPSITDPSKATPKIIEGVLLPLALSHFVNLKNVNLSAPIQAKEAGDEGSKIVPVSPTLDTWRWARLLKCLKALVKYFGGSEHRFMFQHPVIREAVARKYFPNGYADDAMNWAQNLLATYFLKYGKPERKVKELPTLLRKTSRLKDLSKFLKSWHVFDSLIDRFDSGDGLARSWRPVLLARQAKEEVADIYGKQLELSAISLKHADLAQFLERCHNVATMYIDCQSPDLMKAKKLVGIMLGMAKENHHKEDQKTEFSLAEAYWLQSSVYLKIVQSERLIFGSPLKNQSKLLQALKKAEKLFEKSASSSDWSKARLGATLNRLAFAYGFYLALVESAESSRAELAAADTDEPAPEPGNGGKQKRFDAVLSFTGSLKANPSLILEAKLQALMRLTAAQKLFEETGDRCSLGYCLNTKYALKCISSLSPRIAETKSSLLEQAAHLVLTHGGSAHPNLHVVALNIAHHLQQSDCDANLAEKLSGHLASYHSAAANAGGLPSVEAVLAGDERTSPSPWPNIWGC